MEPSKGRADFERFMSKINKRVADTLEFDRVLEEHRQYVEKFRRRNKMRIWLRYFLDNPKNAVFKSYSQGVPEKYKYPTIDLLDWILIKANDRQGGTKNH